ncbi:MAG: tyrosine-type recombinase/integrase [Desulfobacterales bacterium]|nr:tyrosine-type recombinase/integrase [Desulfobacterales bacterium]
MAKVTRVEGKEGVSWRIDYFDPKGKRVRRMFKKKKDAEAELGKCVSLIAENRYLDVKKDYTTKFEELIERYKENFRDQTSFQTAKRFFMKDFLEYFGRDTLLSKITYGDLEAYKNHLMRTPTARKGTIRKPATVNRTMICLHQVFDKAVKWELMERSPFDKGNSLLLKENNKRIRYLTEEEIPRLLAECPKHIKQVVICAINTGMRKGEILSLKWKQVKNGFIYLTETKTDEPREVPINDELAQLFKEIRKEQGMESEYVFTYRHNEDKIIDIKHPVRKRRPAPLKRLYNLHSFLTAVRRAGIKDFQFRDLRHTCASHMVMRGRNLKEVQELLGHTDMKMTLRYSHLSKEHMKESVNSLCGLTGYVKNDMSEIDRFSDFQGS